VTDRALYDSVLTRMKETNVARGVAETNLRMVESPLIAAKPVKPSFLKILALALVAGFVVGCGVVFGVDTCDTSIRSNDQAEKISAIPVLSSVPESQTQKPRQRIRVNQ